MAKKSKIGQLASASTKAAFAEELASLTTLTSDEIKNMFPLKSDRDELVELLSIVTSATDENVKKSELTNKINNVGGAIIKIVKKFASGF